MICYGFRVPGSPEVVPENKTYPLTWYNRVYLNPKSMHNNGLLGYIWGLGLLSYILLGFRDV